MTSSFSHVLTVIGPSETPRLDAAFLEKILTYLPKSGESLSVHTLKEGVAYDIPFSVSPPEETLLVPLTREIAVLTALQGVDFCLSPAQNRRKKLFFADMDSTIIGQECIDEMAALLGLREEVSAITEQAMRGELNFEEALCARVKLLTGLELSRIEELIRTRLQLNPGARIAVQTMRRNGVHCVLVSGGFTLFTEKIAAQVGFHEHHANRLDVKNQRLTGGLHPPLLGKEAKNACLIQIRNSRGFLPEETLAIGDGANDLLMIRNAGLGVAYHAKPALARWAGCHLRFCDLTALLFIQGYTESECVSV